MTNDANDRHLVTLSTRWRGHEGLKWGRVRGSTTVPRTAEIGAMLPITRDRRLTGAAPLPSFPPGFGRETMEGGPAASAS
jgi:hypothetical protein